MGQPVQGIVHALCGERCQRCCLGGVHVELAVDDGIVGCGQVWHVENIAQRPIDLVLDRAFHMGAFAEGEMQRNRCRRCADGDRHIVVFDHQFDLMLQIRGKQVRARDGGGIIAGAGHIAEGEA